MVYIATVEHHHAALLLVWVRNSVILLSLQVQWSPSRASPLMNKNPSYQVTVKSVDLSP